MDNNETESLDQQVENLGSRDWRAVAVVYRTLNEAGENGLDAVVRGLSHPDPRVRKGCAEYLDHNADERCTGPLLQASTDSVPAVRRAALHTLGCQRCKPQPLQGDIIPLLIERALSDSSIRVRRHATAAFHDQPADPRIETVLRQLLEQEQDRDIRRYAYQALRRHDPAFRASTDAAARERAQRETTHQQ